MLQLIQNFTFFAETTSHSGDVFSEIAIIIAIGTAIAFLMSVLKQPLIIGHIITGIIVGPTLFNLVKSEETISVFANLGITLLLFIIGLGLNPKIIKEVGKPAILAGVGQITFTTILGFMLASFLGIDTAQAWLVGIALAFSSTIIALKLIGDKKEQTRLYAKIAVGILLVQDIVATIALLFLASSNDGGFNPVDIALLVAKGFGALFAMWLIASYILPKLNNIIASSQEFLFLFALGWGLGIASLLEGVGFSLEVGALFAGVGLATQNYTQEISARLRPIRDFFVVLFFISLGTKLVIDDLIGVVVPAVLLSVLVIFGNPIIISFILGLLGYTRKISFKVGVCMAQISEFSLVFAILAERQGKLETEVLSILTLVALITFAVSSYIITYADQLYGYLSDHFQLFENKKVKFDQENSSSYPVILFGYKKGGSEYVKTFTSMKKKFVIIDYNPSVIDTLEQNKLNYLYGDATDLELLDEIGIEDAKLIISTITEHTTNTFLVTHIHAINEKAVIICQSDSVADAIELYEHGASYVIVSHAIGNEKISAFIKRNGFSKTEFKKFREKHIVSLETHIKKSDI